MTYSDVCDHLPTKVSEKGSKIDVKKVVFFDFSGKVAFCTFSKQSRPLQSLYSKVVKVEKKGLFEKPFSDHNHQKSSFFHVF